MDNCSGVENAGSNPAEPTIKNNLGAHVPMAGGTLLQRVYVKGSIPFVSTIYLAF